MTDNLKEEFSIAPYVCQLVRRRPAQRQATKNKRAGVEGKLLLTLLAMFADQQHGVHSPYTRGCDADVWEGFAKRGEGW